MGLFSFLNIFKKCPCCGAKWKDRKSFVGDKSLNVIGYQANFRTIGLGILLFDHSCGTTLAMPIKAFKDIYDGPVYEDRKTGGPDCPGYCLRQDELRPCPAKCECAWAREIVNILKTGKSKSK